jgi:putative CRISPR-associated protein (TIGR02619 family)
MKKIITTVGTSLITNQYDNKDFSDLKKYSKQLEKSSYSEFDKKKQRITKLRGKLDKLINSNNPNLSAEISSIIKIIEQEPNEDYDVYLLATDTILSPICAEYVKKWFEKNKVNNIETIFFDDRYIIKKLQVKNKNDFEREGLTNLFTKIQEISGTYWDSLILNITGGYKAIIPFMSIVAQIYQLPAYYIFQESKDDKFELLKIPNLPITINENIFENFWNEINEIAENGTKPNYNIISKLKSIIEIEQDTAMLTSLGYVLWEKYKEQFFIFYCTDDVWKAIQKQKDIKRILETKFWNGQERNSKTERKQEHYVFDDGNNNNRIYYFIEDKKIFIYKTFENEEKAKKFIETKINKESIKQKSKTRKIKKEI